MVQNIRPPQDSYFHQPQAESITKTVREGNSGVEADLTTSTQPPIPTKEQLEQAAAGITNALRGTTSRLQIDIDPDLQQAVFKVINGESGEVIRQIPSQELLDLAKHLDKAKGILVRQRA